MKTNLAALLLIGLTLAGCGKSNDRTLQGWVEAELVFVSPDEQGRVETLKKREGDSVQKGDLLFGVDEDLQQADVTVKQVAVTNAQQQFDRAKELLKTSSGTQKTYEDAEAALRQAKANLEWSQTRLTRRRAVAPAAGVIQQVYFRPGETVPPGRPVMSLLPPGNLKLRFFAPERVVQDVKYGATVKVSCDGCEAGLTAKVTFIASGAEYTPPVIYSLDERAKLVFLIEARPSPADAERLHPGQPVDVRLK